MKIKILTDTSCGIPYEEMKKLGYEEIALPFIFDEKEYNENDLSREEFYKKLKESKNIHTSQASLETVSKKFDEILENYEHIIYLPITSGLSGSFASANVLLSDDKYKDKVTCIDHRSISVLQRKMLEDVNILIEKGVAPDKIKELVEKNASNHRIYIVVDTLDYLKKGGRVSALTAAVGNLLNIKPILFSDGGKFDVVKKVRSIKAAEDTMIELISNDFKEKFAGESLDNFAFGVAYTECLEECEKYRKNVSEYFNKEVIIDELPPVIACHLGVGAIGTAVYKRINEC